MNLLNKLGCLFAGVIVLSGCATTRNPWRDVTKPTSDTAESIGFYRGGCLRGAKSLFADGPGYRVMRISRRKFYGHPRLIQFIEDLAKSVSKKKIGVLLIGDLGLPRGGPALTGHLSHQNGLDVDIWFTQLSDLGHELSLDDRENLTAMSMLGTDGESLNISRWTPKRVEILRLAAESPEVERIFVNPVIKRELCAKVKNRSWLKKIRPWWAHDDHFHVRLKCTPTDKQCVVQEAIAEGEGCDKAFEDEWFSPEARERAKKMREAAAEAQKMPPMPEACQAVLNEK